jgi:hypothetical protein
MFIFVKKVSKMVFKIEVLNENALDLLKSLEKLNLIKLFSNSTVNELGMKPRTKLTKTEFENKVLASKSSKVSYHFEGNQFNDVVNSLIKEEFVDMEKYKIIEE